MRSWHALTWTPGIPDREGDHLALANPHESAWLKDYDGREGYVAHQWAGPPERTGQVLYVEGWNLARVRKVYSEQRARYLARAAGIS